MRKYKESLADFDESIKLGLNDGRVYLNRGVALDGLGRHAEAIKDYGTSIKLEPGNATAYFNRGESFAREGQDDAAIADYSRAVGIEPQFASAYWNRATLFLKKHNYAAAISDYSLVEKLEPENGHVYGCLAALYATCPEANFRNGAVAIEYATKANKLGDMPQHLTLAALAAANAESGHFDQAVEWQTKSIQSAPESDRMALKVRLNLYKWGKPFHGDFFDLGTQPSESQHSEKK